MLQKINQAWDDIYIYINKELNMHKCDLKPIDMYQVEECQEELMKQVQGITIEKCLSKTDGIAALVSVMLYGLGWMPITYKKWIDPNKDEWILEAEPDQPFPIMTVIRAVIESYHRYMANQARNHYQGDTIGKIIAWDTVLSKNQSLKRKKRYPELAILETIQVGAAWPCTRVAHAYPGEESVCALCGQVVTDCWHALWTCPKIVESQEEAIVKSNYLIEKLEMDKISFFNRAFVSEEELVIGDEFDPLDIYPIQTETLTKEQEDIRYRPCRYENDSRKKDTPEAENIEVKPVLYAAPAWVQDCGVYELLKECGLDPEASSSKKRKRIPDEEHDPTARSSHENAADTGTAVPIIDNDEMDMRHKGIKRALDEAPNQDENIEDEETEGMEGSPWPSGYYFGDGSGGKYSRYPTITRCGVGVHYVDPDKVAQINRSTPLPGKIQTNNRAELYAL